MSTSKLPTCSLGQAALELRATPQLNYFKIQSQVPTTDISGSRVVFRLVGYIPGTDVMIFKIFSPKKLAFWTQNNAKF
jgi:hypothetical protein